MTPRRRSRSGWQGKGTLEELMRERIRATIETIIDEELESARGAASSRRAGPVRAGYRHGKRLRTLTTSLGATTIAMPRARIADDDGRRREWRSQIIPCYKRYTERVDEAMGVSLERHQHAAPARSAGAAAAWRAAVERCWIALGGAVARGLRGRGRGGISANGGTVTCLSTAGIRGCGPAKRGADHPGGMRQRPAHGARFAAGRRRE
jgi:hypothetical protein